MEELEYIRRLYNMTSLMRGMRPVLNGDDSEEFTEGYLQALDDLLAWFGDELHR
jgi:hypothetical protein